MPSLIVTVTLFNYWCGWEIFCNIQLESTTATHIVNVKKMYLLQHFSNILALRIKHNKVRKKRRTFTTFYFPDNFWQGLAQISHFTSRCISILWATLVYLYFMCPLFLEIHFRYSNLFSSYFPRYIFILHIYTLIYTYRYRSKKK